VHALTATELDAEGPDGVDLVPVLHQLVINTPAHVIVDQVRTNLARGLPELKTHHIRRWGDRTLSLCGSAPSLMHNLHKLSGQVMAINGAIGALHKANVRVDYAMIWDASPEMVRYAADIPGCEWMICSRVNPELIDRLLELNQKVTLWHRASTEPEMAALLMDRLNVFGGPTGITAGVFLAGAMGFRDLRIFGADSSYSDDTHVGGSVREEHEIMAAFEGEIYRTTMWMLHQAESWVKFVVPHLVPTGMRFQVYGAGLLPSAHRSWMQQCLTPRQRWSWRWLSRWL